MSRIVIAGVSGFMGRYIASGFRATGDEVRTIGRRSADAAWGDHDALRTVVEGADLVLNLAGRSVNCRYDPANRAEILRSRIETTRDLGAAIRAARTPPALWINSSTATIYRHAEDRPMTEVTGEIGTGFSVEVAKAWEAAFFEADLPDTRRVALRTAIVLGNGSALVPLLRLAQWGLGGPQLDGRWPASRTRLAAGTYHRFAARGGHQRFSWVHLADVLGVVRFLLARRDLDGVINVASPHVVDNVELMRTIRRVVGMPIGLPTPRPLLEFGSWLIRTETELVLKSRWVRPQRLLDAGYAFQFPDLEPALREIVHVRSVR